VEGEGAHARIDINSHQYVRRDKPVHRLPNQHYDPSVRTDVCGGKRGLRMKKFDDPWARGQGGAGGWRGGGVGEEGGKAAVPVRLDKQCGKGGGCPLPLLQQPALVVLSSTVISMATTIAMLALLANFF
jgi:hypothetical protein